MALAPYSWMRRAAIAAALVTALPCTARAQAFGPYTVMPLDATPVAARSVRFRAQTNWTRATQQSDSAGNFVDLAYGLTTDTLGAAQFPGLATSLRALTGDPAARLSIGRLGVVATARTVTVPLSLDYGLTSRLSIGVTVPVVQSRTSVVVTSLDSTGATAGMNPLAYATNAQVQAAFAQAAADLRAAIDGCRTSPSGPGCSTILADSAAASQLATGTAAFAAAVTALYGTGAENPGSPFVPRTGTALLTAINNQIAALNAQYQTYMGRTITSLTLGGGGAPIGTSQLDAFLRSPGLGGLDSGLTTVERIGIGDVEVSATSYLGGAGRWRAAVQALVRLPTGTPSRNGRLFDQGTGDGQLDVEGAGTLELRPTRRFALTTAARYTAQMGSVRVARAPTNDGMVPVMPADSAERQPGDIVQVDVVPRYLLTPFLGIDARVSVRRRGEEQYLLVTSGSVVQTIAAATEQRVGIGFSYSTLGHDAGPGTLPMDVAFVHMQTVRISGGPALRTSDNVVRVRLYFRAF